MHFYIFVQNTSEITSGEKKVLYVDDEQINCQMFLFNFRREYDVLVAESGAEGLEIIRNNRIEAIISDLKMPEMDGIEFISKAKTNLPRAKTYILSGFDRNEEVEKALNSGLVNDFFQKPMNIVLIKETLNKALLA